MSSGVIDLGISKVASNAVVVGRKTAHAMLRVATSISIVSSERTGNIE
ncbi:hypothetical protein [Mycobacteroides abscessus]|nr:hypothetical protein [Mycobacteroides abscessus]